MTHEDKKYNILVLSNEKKIVNKISILFESSKYKFELVRDPLSALKNIGFKNYDLIIINFTFTKEILEMLIRKIRYLDSFTYIALIYEDSNLNDTLDLVRNYDIQGYYNKNENFNQLIILINLITNSIYEFMRINFQLDNYDVASRSPYLSTVKILRNIVEYKDTYTIGHSFRVCKYSVLIGKKLGLSRTDLKILKVGSMFHDIGKISTPNNILLKNSKLTDNEYLQVKSHPLIGSHFLFPAVMYSKTIPIIKFHHERFDGTGYPAKLKGNNIPLLTRIVTVADSFDAMASKRNYRDALSFDDIILEFEKNKNYQFDPEITDAFISILRNNFNQIKKIQKIGIEGKNSFLI